MGATLDSIDGVIFAALQTIARPGGHGTNANGPFNFLDRWVGPPPRIDETSVETFGKAPSILLAFEDESDTDDVATMGMQREYAATSTWTVLVCVSDPRGATKVAKGSAGIPGGLALCGTVIDTVNGLIVPGPAATLAFLVTGAPNATVAIGTQVLIGSPYVFTPLVTSVSLDSSGNGYINAACTFPQWDLGNLNPGSVLTWTPAVAGLGATARVVAAPVVGVNGLLRRDELVTYRRTQRLGYVAGRILVYGVRFSAVRAAEHATPEDSSQRLDSILNGLYLEQTADVAPNPIVQFVSDVSVAAIPGIAFWYRGDSLSADGSTWTDLSGNGNHALQATPALRFTPVAQWGANNVPAALGNGSQWMATAAPVDLSGATQLDVFVVTQPNSALVSGGNAIVNNTQGLAPNGPQFEELVFGGDQYEADHFGPTQSTASEAYTTPVSPVNSAHIVEFQHDQTVATNQATVLLDGVAMTMSRPINQQASGGFGNRILAIGRNDNTGQHMAGTLVEIIGVKRTVTTAERNQILSYLSVRNRMPVTLS